jgi:hypothetical protein
MLQHRHAQNALQAILHLLRERRAARYNEPQSVRRLRILEAFCLVPHGGVKRGTCRVVGRPQDIEPLIQRHDGTVRRDGNAAARQERCEDRYFEPMGIVRRRYAQATVRGCEAEPGLKACGRRQHIAMTERNELWLRGRARCLQDEGGRARTRLSVDRRRVGDPHGDIESKLTVSDWSGIDDGEPSPLSGLASFRGTALRHEKSVQAQHVETLIDLRRGQPRIKRNRDAAARYCHNGENRLQAVRHEHTDPGVAIEPSQTQLPPDIVQLALKIVVRQRRKRGGEQACVGTGWQSDR